MGRSPGERVRQIETTVRDTVELVQVTDCHIFADDEERLKGLNTRQSFAAVKESILRDNGNLDLLLLTGDLSQDGSAESYAYLAQQFNAIGLPTFWLPGNHDEVDVMQRHFTGKRIHAANQILAGAWQILMLDSTVAGEVHGRVSKSELEFMDAALQQYPHRHALVCLHHQAVETGSAWIDMKGLKDADRLRDRLIQHGNLRAVLWGHVHQETHTRINSIEWMSTPSSCVQFKPGSRVFAIGLEAPGYRYIKLNPDGSIETRVHRVESFDFDIDYSKNGC